jgi:O-antigen/teichoic acid export membrane protein
MAIGFLRDRGVGGSLLRSSAAVCALDITGVGLGFGVHLLAANLLGARGYGDFVVPTTWIVLLSGIGMLGFGTASLRYLPMYAGQKQWSPLIGFLRRSLGIVLVTSVSCSVLMIGTVLGIRERLSPPLFWSFCLAAIVLPLRFVLQLHAFHLQALHAIIPARLATVLVQPAALAAVLAATALAAPTALTAVTGMSAQLVSYAIALALIVWFMFRAVPRQAHRAVPEYHTRQWLGVALPMLLVTSSHLVIRQSDTIMLGALGGSAAAGCYSAAARLTQLTLFGMQAMNAVLAPRMSHLHARGQLPELQRLVRLAAWGTCAFTLPVGVLLLAFGQRLLGLFGAPFAAAYPALLIILVGQLINSLSGPVGFLMTMTGHQNHAAVVCGLAALLNLALNAWLIPTCGMNGAAIATAAATAFWNLALVALVWHKLGIRSTIL